MFDNSKVSDIQVMSPELTKENCEFVKISRDKDPASKSYRAVTFEFVDSKGAVLNHREFAPNRVINGTVLTDDEFKKNINLAHSRVAHISRAFLSEAEFLAIKVEGDLSTIDASWDNYIILTARALGVNVEGVPAKAKGVKCSLKVVLQHQKSTNKYFSSLPKVPPFISTTNHPKVFSINPQYDIFEVPKVTPDLEKTNQSQGSGFGNGPATNTPQQQPAQQGFGGGEAAKTTHESDF